MDTSELDPSDSNSQLEKNGTNNTLRRSSRVTARAKTLHETKDVAHNVSSSETSSETDCNSETALLKKMQCKLLKQKVKKKKLKASLGMLQIMTTVSLS